MALTDLLEKIDALKQEADSLRPIPKDRIAKLNDKLRLEWTYHSNAIEGNTLTLSETRVLLQQGIHMGNKLGRHYEEMKLHEEVILALEEIVHDKRPFSEVLIRQLHHRLMGDDYFVDAFDSLGEPKKVKGKPGEYKDMTNGVRRIVNGKEKFVPFKTPDEVRMEMPELVQWYLEDEQKQEYHPVVRAAILHYRFVTIHPFDDGNGRMGRILMNLALMRSGYVPAIVRVEEREAYIRNLAIAQDGGDLEPFLELVAEETLRSMELLVKAAKGENIEEPEDIEKRIANWKRGLVSDQQVVEGTPELIHSLIQKSIESLLILLQKKVDENFSELFSSRRTDIHMQGNGGASFNTPHVKQVAQIVQNQLPQNPKFFKLTFDYVLLGFLKNGTNTFNTVANLEVEFSTYYYIIRKNGNEEMVRKLYSDNIDEYEQREMVSQVLKDVFTKIQQNIKP